MKVCCEVAYLAVHLVAGVILGPIFALAVFLLSLFESAVVLWSSASKERAAFRPVDFESGIGRSGAGRDACGRGSIRSTRSERPTTSRGEGPQVRRASCSLSSLEGLRSWPEQDCEDQEGQISPCGVEDLPPPRPRRVSVPKMPYSSDRLGSSFSLRPRTDSSPRSSLSRRAPPAKRLEDIREHRVAKGRRNTVDVDVPRSITFAAKN